MCPPAKLGGALSTQCIARIDQSWPTWKNTHTLRIIVG